MVAQVLGRSGDLAAQGGGIGQPQTSLEGLNCCPRAQILKKVSWYPSYQVRDKFFLLYKLIHMKPFSLKLKFLEKSLVVGRGLFPFWKVQYALFQDFLPLSWITKSPVAERLGNPYPHPARLLSGPQWGCLSQPPWRLCGNGPQASPDFPVESLSWG